MKVAKGETTLRFEVPDGEGAVILYKRCPRPLYEDLRKAHIADERVMIPFLTELTKDIAAHCATGWENVTELDTGEALEFSPEHFVLMEEKDRMRLGFVAAEHILHRSPAQVEDLLQKMDKAAELFIRAQYGIKPEVENTVAAQPKTEEPELTVPLPDSSVSPTT